jgi:hypothetical protein
MIWNRGKVFLWPSTRAVLLENSSMLAGVRAWLLTHPASETFLTNYI